MFVSVCSLNISMDLKEICRGLSGKALRLLTFAYINSMWME